MIYPTLEQVQTASHIQLAHWYRFLPSPGIQAAGDPSFEETLEREAKIMALIRVRLNELGGITPAISKAIGW